jgi:large subunit ribosomal protein L24
MAANKAHIRRDDVVEVLAGRDRGKKGRVLRVFPKKERALVEGVNFINKAVRPDAKMNQTGGFVRKEGMIHLSNLRKSAEGAKAKKGAE